MTRSLAVVGGLLVVAGGAALWWWSAAAGGGGAASSSPPAFDRRQVLADVGRLVIRPTLEDLERATAALAEAPDGPRWRRARLAWKRCEAFGFGPAKDLHIAQIIDFHPPRPGPLARFLEGDDPATAAALARSGAVRRGFGALEYMLFGPAADRREARAVALRQAMAQDIDGRARALGEAWLRGAGERPAYLEELTRAGAGSETFAMAQLGIDHLVSQLIVLVNEMAADRLGRPLGQRAGGTPQPARVESRWAAQSIPDLLATLDGVESVYRAARVVDGERAGEDGVGLDDLARHLDPELDARLQAAIAAARAALGRIERPLARAVEADPAPVEAAAEALAALHRLLATDLVGKLGVRYAFSDADGD